MGEPNIGHVLTLDCAETPGIVHAVSGFLVEHGCDIVDNERYTATAPNAQHWSLRCAGTARVTVTGYCTIVLRSGLRERRLTGRGQDVHE